MVLVMWLRTASVRFTVLQHGIQINRCIDLVDIFSSKEILTAMRVMVVSIGSRGSHIPAMTPRRLRRGVIAGM